MKALILAEKNGVRYIGEIEYDQAVGIEASIGLSLPLKNVFELARMQLVTDQGPQIQHALLPIGLDGQIDWTIERPDGRSVVEDGSQLQRMYQARRARASGLSLASAGSIPPARGGLPGLPGMPSSLPPGLIPR